MRKRIFLAILMVFGIINGATAQQSVFKVQGHERPDLQERVNTVQKKRFATRANESFTFEDITFWIGKGSNRAALVIDWYDNKGTTLAWGFRWDGTATGYDMICAIAKADPRFIYLSHDTSMGKTIGGMGYDLNKSGSLFLLFNGNTETPHLPIQGMVETSAYDYDSWSNNDPQDHWKSGWTKGYWSYQLREEGDEEFSYASSGCYTRELANGSWDGWGFQEFSNPSQEGNQPRPEFTAATSPFPSFNAFWSEMGKEASHQSIVNLPIAKRSEELSEKWKTQLSESWISGGQPLIVNKNVYIAVNNNIRMIDAQTGSILKEQTLVGSCGFFSMIAYGEGKVFVPQGDGILQAFNAETLEPIWQTELQSGYQQMCPVVYHDGYVYTGNWKGGSPATGTYYCVSAEDEDSRSNNEIKETTWESDNSGFYWSGGTVVDNYIFFGGDSGYIQSRNRKTGQLIDSYQVAPELAKSTIRSGSSYDASTQMLYFATKEAKKIFGIKLNSDGTFNKTGIISNNVLGQSTTTPTVYNGRIYCSSGTNSGGGGLDVFNALTLERIYSANIGGISQSTPLLTTAYATPENQNTVYLYVCLNNQNGSIVCLKDFEGNTEPLIEFAYTPSSPQYCTHSLIADQDGVIYYRNDAKYLFALQTQSSPTSIAGKEERHEISYYDSSSQTIHLNADADGTATIYHISNQSMRNAPIRVGENLIDARSLSSGVYLIRFNNQTLKFIR